MCLLARLAHIVLLSSALTLSVPSLAASGVTISPPNGYARLSVEDLRVHSIAGPVSWGREWTGEEWRFNPRWESLSRSWTNLT
ncbi:hypothetical protein, partial [Chitiniphilus shinanonensis]|uniref:hypothetical protein n=1 Tax=Chitiniphilus shinanonensis TaxID=553088 RepID=UPI00333E715D